MKKKLVACLLVMTLMLSTALQAPIGVFAESTSGRIAEEEAPEGDTNLPEIEGDVILKEAEAPDRAEDPDNKSTYKSQGDPAKDENGRLEEKAQSKFFTEGSLQASKSEKKRSGEAGYEEFKILGVTEEVGQMPGKPFNFYDGVYMVPEKDDWIEGDEFRVAVTGVDTPPGGSYTFKEGDNFFTPVEADNGKNYVVHYEIQKKDGENWLHLDKPVTARTTVKVFAVNEIKPVLDSDDAEVTKLYTVSVTDGTDPFDDNDEPGNDRSAENKIVRSFDSVQYELGYANKVKSPGVAYLDGYINFEMVLPYPEKIARFDTEAMGWMATDPEHMWSLTTDIDGYQVLKASRRIISKDGKEAAIPNAGQVPVIIEVREATNGTRIKPVFKAWMDYNDVVKQADVPMVTVSAGPRYNVQLKNGDDRYVGAFDTFDFTRGDENAFHKDAGMVFGQLQGLGVTLQIYNDRADKGLKGVEFPNPAKGISFDIDVSAYFHDSKNNKNLEAGMPLLWAFDETKLRGELQGGRPVLGEYANYDYAAVSSPANRGGKLHIKRDPDYYRKQLTKTVYDGGKWTIEYKGNGKYHLTVKDFALHPDAFPSTDLGGSTPRYYTPIEDGVKNIGAFSAASLFFVVPLGGSAGSSDPEYYPNKYKTTGNVNFTVEDNNLIAESVTGQKVTDKDQVNKEDDVRPKNINAVPSGTLAPHIHYTHSQEEGLATGVDRVNRGQDYYNGTDAMAIGDKVDILWGINLDTNGLASNAIYAGNYLMKFDDEALEIDPGKLPHYSRPSDNYDLAHSFLYAAKEDGKGWLNDEEMNAAREEDLVYYKSLQDLKASGKICVGILAEARKKSDKPIYSEIQDRACRASFNIKSDTDNVGKNFQTVIVVNVWDKPSYENVIKEYGKFPTRTELNPGTELPKAKHINICQDYKKDLYDETGWLGGEGVEPYYGDTLYLVPYKTIISQKISQFNDHGKPKEVYDLDFNQFTVDYELIPSMIVQKDVTWPNPTTMKIVDTLPKGMEYVIGSSYYGGKYLPSTLPGYSGKVEGGTLIEPSVEKQDDGTTVLTWEIQGVKVQRDVPRIYFKALMDSTTKTNALFKNTVQINTSEDQSTPSAGRGNMNEHAIRTSKTVDISLSKTSEYITHDPGQEINYTLKYLNNGKTDKKNQLMLDILPVNGQEGSAFSENGKFEIKGVAVTPSGASQSAEAKTADDYEIYYSTDEVFSEKLAADFDAGEIAAGSGGGATWHKLSLDSNGKVNNLPAGIKMTALALIGDINAGQNVSMSLKVDTTGNEPGDKYVNKTSLSSLAITNTTYVVKRMISGVAWFDANLDGKRDRNEKLLPGIKVTLYDEKDQVAVNHDNKECITTTDKNGYYVFDNLKAKDINTAEKYKVVFTSGKTDLGEYQLTINKAAGVSSSQNSDAVSAGLTGEGAYIPDVEMLPVSELYTSPYIVRHLDAGFFKPSKKYAEDTPTGSENAPVKIGDIIKYEVTFTQPDENNQFVTILEDEMSKGLKLIPESVGFVKIETDNDGKHIERDVSDWFHEADDKDSAGMKDHKVIWSSRAGISNGNYKLTYKAEVVDAGQEQYIVHNDAYYQVGTNHKVKLDRLENPVSKKDYNSKEWQEGKIVSVGTDIPYKVSLGNKTDNVVDIVLQDTMTKGLTFNDDLKLCDKDGNEIKTIQAIQGTPKNNDDGSVTYTWTIKDVPKKSNLAYVAYSGKVTEDARKPGAVTNSATIRYGDDPEIKLENLTNPLIKKDVFKAGDDKVSIDGKAVKPEEELLYKISYKNTTGTDQDIVIKDTIPAYTTYIEGSADQSGVFENGEVTWNKKLANGEAITVSFKVKVDKKVNGKPIDNVARIKDGVNKSYVSTNTTHNPTPSDPEKEVFKGRDTANIDGEEVQPGDELTYKITYRNTTGGDQEIVITDKIPAYTTYVEKSADNDGIYENGVLTWTRNVKDGKAITVSFKVRVDKDVNGKTVDNKGVVKAGDYEYVTNETKNPTPTKSVKNVFNTGSENVSINGQAVNPGEELLYKITYKNTTGGDREVTIRDRIPKYTSYVEDSADNAGNYANGEITWKKIIEKGEVLTVSFKVRVDKDVNGKTVDNKGVVKVGDYEYVTNETKNPTPTKSVKAVFNAGDDEESIDGKEVQPGDYLTYKITYRNTTGKDQEVVIKDTIPAYTTYIIGSADQGGIFANGEIVWTKAVKDGETLTVSFKVKVGKAANGKYVINTARVKDEMNESYLNTNTTKNHIHNEAKISQTTNTGDMSGLYKWVGLTIILAIALLMIVLASKKNKADK